mgnify:CR=1 FL=1
MHACLQICAQSFSGTRVFLNDRTGLSSLKLAWKILEERHVCSIDDRFIHVPYIVVRI